MDEKHLDCSQSILDSYYQNISKYPLLSPDEEARLLKNFQTARGRSKNIIREKLINSNLRLVVKIAKNFQGCGLPLEDLVNEGNLGLMKAVEKYKLGKKTKLSYYSSFWIKQSIYRALTNKSRLIRLPCGAFDDYNKITRLINFYKKNFDREPSTQEISEKLNLSEIRISTILDTVSTPKSLDDFFQDSGNGKTEKSYAEVVEDDKVPSVEEFISKQEDVRNLKSLLKDLTEREYDILMYRFGLENHDQETLEVIGRRHNVTRERIRQIEGIALKKLKAMFEKKYKDNV